MFEELQHKFEERRPGEYAIPLGFVSTRSFLYESDLADWIHITSQEVCPTVNSIDISTNAIILKGCTKEEAEEFAFLVKLTWTE